MIKLAEIVSYLDDYLKIGDVEDSSWNGLQFEGKAEVGKAVFAVDAGIQTFEKAVQTGADLLVVHHGLFWSGNPSLAGWMKRRIDPLYKNELSLYAVHLPLDRHKEVGNNARIIKILGGEIVEEFHFHEGKNIGWIGKWDKGVKREEIIRKLDKALAIKSKVLPFGPEIIKTVAVVSGGGGYQGFYEAVEKKADLFLTGDAVEVYHSAKDARLNVIFAGHHASETVGLKALMKVVSKEFKLETEFLDLPTGL